MILAIEPVAWLEFSGFSFLNTDWASNLFLNQTEMQYSKLFQTQTDCSSIDSRPVGAGNPGPEPPGFVNPAMSALPRMSELNLNPIQRQNVILLIVTVFHRHHCLSPMSIYLAR